MLIMSRDKAISAAFDESSIPQKDRSGFLVLVNKYLNEKWMRSAQGHGQVEKDIHTLIPKHLENICCELEEESKKRTYGWGKAAIKAIKNGRPKWKQLREAETRAIFEYYSNKN